MSQKKKIMVVDDEENLLFLVSKILESQGFDVITASSGHECLDLLMLDIMMPGLTGIDLQRL